MSYELHPPIEVDKGTTVELLGEGLDVVTFMGDDVGDIPGFEGLDRLAARGAQVVRVAVRSTEQAPALLDRADVVVDGPLGALALLQSLLDD